MKESYIELSDGRCAYSLEGPAQGQVLLLVHGNAAPSCSWDRNTPALVRSGFRVLRFDLFGHGFSERPELSVYNKELYLRQIFELCTALRLEKPLYMAGTSQGGSIAAGFAAAHPGFVSKLALLSPYFDSFRGKGLTFLLRSPLGERMIASAGEKALCDPSRGFISDRYTIELTRKLKEACKLPGRGRAVLANLRGDSFRGNEEAYRELGRQGIPLLLSWGDRDRSIPAASMQRLRQLLPELEYHQLSGAGHLAHYEFAEQVNRLLIRFFRFQSSLSG